MINMEIQKQNAAIDLRLTLIDAAQCFHWVETERGFGAVLEGNAVWLRAGEGVIDPRLRRYLDLDRDYASIFEEYADIPAAQAAFATAPACAYLISRRGRRCFPSSSRPTTTSCASAPSSTPSPASTAPRRTALRHPRSRGGGRRDGV